jgi:hypothetical protein
VGIGPASAFALMSASYKRARLAQLGWQRPSERVAVRTQEPRVRPLATAAAPLAPAARQRRFALGPIATRARAGTAAPRESARERIGPAPVRLRRAAASFGRRAARPGPSILAPRASSAPCSRAVPSPRPSLPPSLPPVLTLRWGDGSSPKGPGTMRSSSSSLGTGGSSRGSSPPRRAPPRRDLGSGRPGLPLPWSQSLARRSPSQSSRAERPRQRPDSSDRDRAGSRAPSVLCRPAAASGLWLCGEIGAAAAAAAAAVARLSGAGAPPPPAYPPGPAAGPGRGRRRSSRAAALRRCAHRGPRSRGPALRPIRPGRVRWEAAARARSGPGREAAGALPRQETHVPASAAARCREPRAGDCPGTTIGDEYAAAPPGLDRPSGNRLASPSRLAPCRPGRSGSGAVASIDRGGRGKEARSGRPPPSSFPLSVLARCSPSGPRRDRDRAFFTAAAVLCRRGEGGEERGRGWQAGWVDPLVVVRC